MLHPVILKIFSRALLAAILTVAINSSAALSQQADMGALLKRFNAHYLAGDYASALIEAQQMESIAKSRFGIDRTEYALALNNLANVYIKQGKYTEAEELHLRVLTIREKALGADHPDVAQALNNLAVVYQAQGKYGEAEQMHKRALAIYEKALGANQPKLALTLNNLAGVLRLQGKYAEAEQVGKRALAMREKALGANHPDVAQALNTLALVYKAQGKYAEAEQLYKRALAIREKALGAYHPDVAQALNNLAATYHVQGKYTEAEQLYKRALAIYEKAIGADHPAVALTLNNLAGVFQSQGNYAEAEQMYKRALAIREKALGANHPDVAHALNSLAVVFEERGKYAGAVRLYQRALPIYEKALGADHPDVALTLNNLAGVFRLQGKYAEAEQLGRRALAIREKTLGANHPDVAQALNGLALVFRLQGKYAEAEQMFKRALTIREKALGADHPDVAQALNNLAVISEAQAKYAEAEQFYTRALTIDEKALGANHPSVATYLINLANLFQLQGKYAEAEQLHKRALAIREKALGADHPAVAQALNDLSFLYARQGRYADALPLIETTIARRNAKPANALPVLFGAQGAGLTSPANALDDALNVVQRASQTSAAGALNSVAVRVSAGNDRLAGLVRKDQDLSAEAVTLNSAIIDAVSKEPSKRDSASEQRIRDRLAWIVIERDSLRKVFAAEFPDYAALSRPEPLTCKDIQNLLGADDALVAFSIGDKESYVFAVTREGAEWKKAPIGRAALAQKVSAFRHGLDLKNLSAEGNGEKPELFDLGLAYELYAALLGPVEESIKGKTNLLVVPTSSLTALPFHLLVTDTPAKAVPELKDIASYRDAAWLLKRQAVSVLPSIASLKALRVFASREHSARPLIGFGDPIFDPAERAAATAEKAKADGEAVKGRIVATRASGDLWNGVGIDRAELARALPSLLDTADELKAVAADLGAPASDVHLGKDASETTVKRAALADYRVVYFATHGLVAGDVKETGEPSLALTLPPNPTDLDDGLLTASEVAQLKLNADWVVLSACNTAAGNKPGAEALSGLARAFFYAGARALLVSHWSIDSHATVRIITSTFDNIKADPSAGRAEALRRAMLAYLNDESGPVNAYPAFWGAFEVVGEGRAPAQ